MSTLLIEGGRRLSGRITVDGNKNSALPLVAACLLSDETCRLENVPRISDIRVMADLLTGVGARVSGLGTPSLEISTPKVTSDYGKVRAHRPAKEEHGARTPASGGPAFCDLAGVELDG
jgi:UDP-N-acetylglucosamine enolpyruvyl transferase